MNLCGNSATAGLMYIFGLVMDVICYITPVILIIMLIIELVKAVASADSEINYKSIVNKVIAAISIYVVPTLITSLVVFLGGPNVESLSCYRNITWANVIELREAEEVIRAKGTTGGTTGGGGSRLPGSSGGTGSSGSTGGSSGGSSGGTSTGNSTSTSYGDKIENYTFPTGKKEFLYYNQGKGNEGGIKKCNSNVYINSNGCGILAIGMVAYYLNGIELEDVMVEVCKLDSNGKWNAKDEFGYKYLRDSSFLDSLDLEYTELINPDEYGGLTDDERFDILVKAVENSPNPIIVRIPDHYTVITQVKRDGKIYIYHAESGRSSYSDFYDITDKVALDVLENNLRCKPWKYTVCPNTGITGAWQYKSTKKSGANPELPEQTIN